MRVPHKYRELLNDVKTAVVSDAPRRRLSFYVLNYALSLISLIMTIVNAFTSEFLLLAVTLTYAVVCFINSLLISRNRVMKMRFTLPMRQNRWRLWCSSL